jgi:hypothetical protein
MLSFSAALNSGGGLIADSHPNGATDLIRIPPARISVLP